MSRQDAPRAALLRAEEADGLLQSAEGKREVGEICAALGTDGWHALHGVSIGRGNIDHILVGPGGIFTIRLNSHRGRIPIDRIDPKMFVQAYAEKRLLEELTGRDVQALLVFSRAHLVGLLPAKRRGVTILPARMLRHYFKRRRPVLDAPEATRLHARLAATLPAG